SYLQLASALVCSGAPNAAIRAALEAGASNAVIERDATRVHASLTMAVYEGRFADVADLVRERETALSGSSDLLAHWQAAGASIVATWETKGAEAGAKEAGEWLGRSGGWSGDLRNLFAPALAIALAAPTRTRAAFLAERAAWTSGVADETTFRGFDPLLFAGDEAETRAALPLAKAVAPRPIGWIQREVFMARAAQRIGDWALAKATFERVLDSCMMLEEPWLLTRAQIWLGETLEKLGDTSGACTAYAKVVARWGEAKPRSTTADEARAHGKAIACKGS
ncbi:MAG: tol-pal system YbgF family protein, partial [Polyangiales bacterium]